MVSRSHSKVRLPWILIALLLLLGLDALLLWLSPAEQTLGQVVKLVYIHGALIRSSIVVFLAAALLALVWLFRRRAALFAWLVAFQRTALLTWIAYVLSSMVVTYLAWGVVIAWGEPRVMATARLTMAILVIFGVTQLARAPALTALGCILWGIAATIITQSTGVIRHPLDPIGGSASLTIKWYYAGIVITTIAVSLLVALGIRRLARQR